MDVHEPGEGIFPLPFAQVSQRDVECQRGYPDEPHEN